MVASGIQETQGESVAAFIKLITTKSAQLKQSVKPWQKVANDELLSRL